MDLPDPTRSRAVLIGVDRYRHLADLPAVGNNVRQLAALLKDPRLWGLPPQHCVVLHNPPSADTVLDAVHEAAAEAADALVVYFAGHGLLSPDTDLLLALPESNHERLYRTVPYHLLRHELVDTCTAPSRVVVLDCCYSGRALEGHMGPSVEVAERAGVEGTYVMTASSETKLAWSPEGEEFTAFSGELLKAMTDGVPDAPDPLEMGALFRHVRGELVAKGRPVPQQRARNAGHSIALTRNRWWAAPMLAQTQVAAVEQHAEEQGPMPARTRQVSIRSEPSAPGQQRRMGASDVVELCVVLAVMLVIAFIVLSALA
ncbi:caspase family protein [Streptomyces sp. NPDC054765]